MQRWVERTARCRIDVKREFQDKPEAETQTASMKDQPEQDRANLPHFRESQSKPARRIPSFSRTQCKPAKKDPDYYDYYYNPDVAD